MESNLIHSKLKLKGKNVEWLVSEMTAVGQPISASTIYKKLKGEVVFKASDIKLISKLLELESEEIMVIFLMNWCLKRHMVVIKSNDSFFYCTFQSCVVLFLIV